MGIDTSDGHAGAGKATIDEKEVPMSASRPASPSIDDLRARWRDGPATLGGWSMTRDPLVVEQLARCGFDEVTLDLQHGTIEVADIGALCLAVTTGGAVPLVRVPRTDAVTIGRVLDLGAAGVIVAMVESPATAAAAVAACRYPPLGNRSAGPVRAQFTMGSGDYARLGEVACLVMIETLAGLEAAEAIAATPGIDGVYVGPGDLAISLGIGLGRERTSEETRRFDEALDRVLGACEAAGVVAAIHAPDGTTAASLVARGFGMVTVVADLTLILAGGRAELAAARGSRGA